MIINFRAVSIRLQPFVIYRTVVKVLRVKEMLQKRQAAELGYFTQPENILDADRMNLVEMNIDKAGNF